MPYFQGTYFPDLPQLPQGEIMQSQLSAPGRGNGMNSMDARFNYNLGQARQRVNGRRARIAGVAIPATMAAATTLASVANGGNAGQEALGLGGSVAGSVVGSTVGSIFGPLGSVAGGLAGGAAGGWLADRAGELMGVGKAQVSQSAQALADAEKEYNNARGSGDNARVYSAAQRLQAATQRYASEGQQMQQQGALPDVGMGNQAYRQYATDPYSPYNPMSVPQQQLRQLREQDLDSDQRRQERALDYVRGGQMQMEGFRNQFIGAQDAMNRYERMRRDSLNSLTQAYGYRF